MKLYARTLLFFLGVIGFQALITAGLILGMVSRDNQADARMELRGESTRVYTAYNSWVRILWKSAIRLKDENQLPEGITDILKDTGIDAYAIRNTASAWPQYIILEDANPPITNFSSLIFEKDHPYVSLRLVDNRVYLTAALKYESGKEVFLLKHLDEDFYLHLTESERSNVLITRDENAILKVAENRDSMLKLLNTSTEAPPYLEFFNQDLGKGRFNISFQNLGLLEGTEQEEILYLAVFLSDEPYRSLQYNIGRIVLLVTGITVLITLILGLFSSGRITRPINRLIDGMRSIRSGQYNVKVPVNTLGEVRNLLEGFNEMAQHLNHDRLTMDGNIREITFLKDYNETIIQSLPAGILVMDPELKIEKSNEFFTKSFPQDFPNLTGHHLKNLNTPLVDESVLKSARQIARGEKKEWTGIKRTGDRIWEIKLYPLIQITGSSPGKCVLELNDISRKVELEEKILQAEKLSSLSFLSAGIAHEINNPLSSILTNVQNLQSGVVQEEDRISLQWIEQETQRIARIVRELLDFSREISSGEQSTDVNECLENVLRLTRYGRQPGTGLTIKLDGAENLPRVSIPPDELKQVILNLVQNAVHAVDKHGAVIVTTSYSKSDNIIISVEDNGKGIPSDVLGKIFDPFFTTKTNGEGTGLGLSIVYGIMGKNRGDIDVKSQEGKGTTVTLTLPIREASLNG